MSESEVVSTSDSSDESKSEFSVEHRISEIQRIQKSKLALIEEEAGVQIKACKARLKAVAEDELSDIRGIAKSQKDTANANAKRAVRNWRDVLKSRKSFERKAEVERIKLEEDATKKAQMAEEPKPAPDVTSTASSKEAATPPDIDVPDAQPVSAVS